MPMEDDASKLSYITFITLLGTCVQFLLQHKQVVSELQKLRIEREQLLQQNHDYQAQVKVTEGEVRDLSSELDLLKGKLKEAQTMAGYTE